VTALADRDPCFEAAFSDLLFTITALSKQTGLWLDGGNTSLIPYYTVTLFEGKTAKAEYGVNWAHGVLTRYIILSSKVRDVAVSLFCCPFYEGDRIAIRANDYLHRLAEILERL
jgi:hypothetical protein